MTILVNRLRVRLLRLTVRDVWDYGIRWYVGLLLTIARFVFYIAAGSVLYPCTTMFQYLHNGENV